MVNSDSYDVAEPKENSVISLIKFSWKFFIIYITSLISSIPIFLKWIIHFFIPPPGKNVSGQLCLITGGSTGIGKSLAHRLAKEGCNIAIANRNLDMGQKVADEIAKIYGVNARAFKTDVSKSRDVMKLKSEVEASMGHVDILVNNAGLLALENSLLEGNDEDYQSIIDINLSSYFWTTRAFLPGMMERRRGHILSISSLITKCTTFNAVAYTSTKYGNLGFMEALYDELCFYGYDDCIKTTVVLPALVTTQKKHSQMVEAISDLPRSNSNDIADMIVKGMLQNRRVFTVPQITALFGIVRWFPDEIMKKAKRRIVNMHCVDEYMKIRMNK